MLSRSSCGPVSGRYPFPEGGDLPAAGASDGPWSAEHVLPRVISGGWGLVSVRAMLTGTWALVTLLEQCFWEAARARVLSSSGFRSRGVVVKCA